MRLLISLIGLIFVLTLPQVSQAALSVSGRLTQNGQPVTDGLHLVLFKLYTAPSGGRLIWSEAQPITAQSGRFSARLGAREPLPDFKRLGLSIVYLGITVPPDREMSPRRKIELAVSTPTLATKPGRPSLTATPVAVEKPKVTPTVTPIEVVAGLGLTGGGEVKENKVTLTVGAGTGIVVNADDIAIDPNTVVTLTGTQTLTNKTLTSPTITSPTISDTITLSGLKSCDTLDTNASGVLACGTDASGSTTTSLALSALTAATASTTLANANNPQTWNFAITTADRVGFTFGESSASTATGIPAILRASTVASSTAMPLYIQNLGSAISLRVDDESSDTSPFVISAAGLVGIGTTSPTALLHVPAATASNASIRIPAGTAPTSPNEGDLWNDSTQKALVGFVDGINTKYSGVVFASTASKTVTNTTTQTSIVGTGVGTATLPANFLVAGKTLRIRVSGIYSTSGLSGATMRFRVNFGSTAVLDTTARTPTSSVANRRFELVGLITARSTGSSGTIFSQGVTFVSTSGTAQEPWEMKNTTTTTIDTTASQAVDATIAWGTGVDADDTITGTNAIIEVLN